jgi:crossover junction endodeoxyribonuclease RuvC
MRVLAIDPGFDRLGIAVLEGDPSKPSHVWSDCIKPAEGEAAARLAEIAGAVRKAIKKHTPDMVALEKLFFTKSITSALGVAEARGVVLAAAGEAKVPVKEFSPQEVKMAVTGYGAADKKSVMRMTMKLIKLPEKKRLDDEFDAIALAICALPFRPR